MISAKKKSKDEDDQCVQNLIKDFGLASEVKYMKRIGKTLGKKSCSIKKVLNSSPPKIPVTK